MALNQVFDPNDLIRAQLQAQLKGTDFDFTKPKIRRRLVVEVAAREKRGKTHLAGTAPGPIAYLELDKGEEGVLDKPEFKTKLIIPAHFRLGPTAGLQPTQIMPIADALWKRFTETYRAALKNELFRTIIWDTATEAWDTLRLARFGKFEQVPQHLYGFINREFSDLVREAYDHDKNLILCSRMKKQYKGGERSGKITESYWTGEYERAGYSDLPYIVQVYCESDFNYVDKSFSLTVKECRQNPQLAGETLIPNAEFSMLAMSVMPATTPEDWS